MSTVAVRLPAAVWAVAVRLPAAAVRELAAPGTKAEQGPAATPKAGTALQVTVLLQAGRALGRAVALRAK